ncbi:hypothetical protein B296_00007029 [Ensete ventricosum]|uniref:Uncharacterized protein n=1 Tax=Ensete ventricosum TaxID=4639 RepID=A0A427A820_ENSVE|nr:hypothetical protein B296_00007029 [Ensete ventricosum]
MEMILPSLVASSGLCYDRVGGLEEPLVSDLEENLYPSRVEWNAESLRVVGKAQHIRESNMTSSSEGTCIMSQEWLIGCVAEAFEFSDITSGLPVVGVLTYYRSRGVSTVWSLSSVQARPCQLGTWVSDWSQFSISGAYTLGGLLRELLESVSTEMDLHEGLVMIRVPDVTPKTFKGDPPLALPGGGFILTGRRVVPTLGLTSIVTSGVAALYGELTDTEAWCATWHLWRATIVRLAHRPIGSTSDADVAVVLAQIRLPLEC